MIAKVIVNIPSSNIDQLFDYLIPPEFCDFASDWLKGKSSFW